jgi:sialate O-acetylesterase
MFHAANATIAANNMVEVSSEAVASPVYVRYAYSKVPANPNLFNKEGLPASPFTSQRLEEAEVGR